MNMVSEFEFVKSKYSILIINLVIFAICGVRFDMYNCLLHSLIAHGMFM